MAVCEKCGAAVFPVDRFCPGCGEKLEIKAVREGEIRNIKPVSRNMEWHGKELMERIRTALLAILVVVLLAAVIGGVYLYLISSSRQIRLAQQYSLQQQYAQSEQLLWKVIDRNPDHIKAYSALAQNYDVQKDYTKETWVYCRLLKLDEENQITYYQKLSELYQLRNMRKEQYNVLLKLQQLTGDSQIEQQLSAFKSEIFCFLPEGDYDEGAQVILSTPDSSCQIYYSLQIDHVPGSFKAYLEPISLPAGDIVLKVYAESETGIGEITEYRYQVSESGVRYSLPTFPDVSQYLHSIFLFDVPSPFASLAEMDQSDFGSSVIKAAMELGCNHFTSEEIDRLRETYSEFSGSETFICYEHASEIAQQYFGSGFSLARQDFDFYQYHNVEGGIFTTVPMGEGGKILSLIYDGGKTGSTYVVDVTHYINDYGYDIYSPSGELIGSIDNNIAKSALEQAARRIVLDHLDQLPKRRYTIEEKADGSLQLVSCEILS